MKKAVIILSILLITAFLYSPVTYAPLVYDDYEWLGIVRKFNLSNSYKIFFPTDVSKLPYFGFPYYRPLVGWTVFLNQLAGSGPLAFHAVNLIFHLFNILLIGLIARQIFNKQRGPAILSMVIFSCCPFYYEAVAWAIAGRYHVLGAFFYLSALFCGINYFKFKGWYWDLGSVILYLLALFTVESTVTLPLAVVLINIFTSKTRTKLFPLLTGYICAFGFYFWIRGQVMGNFNPYSSIKYMNLISVSRLFVVYLLILILAIILRKPLNKLMTATYGNPSVFWLTIILTGIFWLPTANIITVERHLYLPFAAASMCVAFIFFSLYKFFQKQHLYKLRLIFSGVLFVVLTAGSILIFQKSRTWRTAGLLAETIGNQTAEIIQKNPHLNSLYLINLPDNINGAYVLGNYLVQFLELKLDRRIPDIIMTPLTNNIHSDFKITGNKSARLISRDGFVLFLPDIDSQGREFNHYPGVLKATLSSRQNMDVLFLDPDFSWGGGNVLLFRNGLVKPVKNFINL